MVLVRFALRRCLELLADLGEPQAADVVAARLEGVRRHLGLVVILGCDAHLQGLDVLRGLLEIGHDDALQEARPSLAMLGELGLVERAGR